ncbi:MAG: anthranilate synthase component II [Anaeroplasmataceae bacterium]
MILIIDNYDSFTYNLYQYIGSINKDILTIRNDEKTVDEIFNLNPSHIIISPGPGTPSEAGIIEELIRKNKTIPILGVCLGHQAICEAFGAKIIHAPQIMHGKRDNISILNNNKLFKGLPSKIEVARYHSLVATDIPDCLEVIARDKHDLVMAVMHKDYKIYGVQFHPESIMTPDGMKILNNFLEED